MGPLSQYVQNWPCASLQRNQLSRKSQDGDFFGISIELVIPTAVELSDWRGLGGCFHPISVRVFHSGTISLAVRNKAVISASAADDTTYLIIWAMVSRDLFQRGMELFSDKKNCGHQLGFLTFFHWQIRSPSVPRGSCCLIDRYCHRLGMWNISPEALLLLGDGE